MQPTSCKETLSFALKLFEKAIKIKWHDKIPDTEALNKAGMHSKHTVLKLAQLRWTGYAMGMPDERLPKKVFRCELKSGKRSPGGRKKLQRHRQSLSGGFRQTDTVMGTGCTGAVSSTTEQLIMKKRKESAENGKPRPMGHQ